MKMRLTKVDERIIDLLNKEKIGLSEMKICSLLNIKINSRGMINKRLRKLEHNHILDKIGKFPIIYYIQGISDMKNIIKVKCKKCENTEATITKQSIICSKCGYRYWITKKRILDFYKGTVIKYRIYRKEYYDKNREKIRARFYAEQNNFKKEFCLLCLLDGIETKAVHFHHTDYENDLGFSVCLEHHKLAERWLIADNKKGDIK